MPFYRNNMTTKQKKIQKKELKKISIDKQKNNQTIQTISLAKPWKAIQQVANQTT